MRTERETFKILEHLLYIHTGDKNSTRLLVIASEI